MCMRGVCGVDEGYMRGVSKSARPYQQTPRAIQPRRRVPQFADAEVVLVRRQKLGRCGGRGVAVTVAEL